MSRGSTPRCAPGGVFVNAEQVAAPEPGLADVYTAMWVRDCRALGATEAEIDGARERMRHDRCADVEAQLTWLREAGLAARRLRLQALAVRRHVRLQGGMMSSTRDWDAATYDRISAPQQRWAAEQLDRLELAGDEVVLDAGCGSGKITLELVRRLPRGTVYAVDAAPSMVAHTQQALGDPATALCQDLVELALPEPVDVVFSNATFHWIPDHDALFAALHRNMKPGARLLAQCGGKGNIDAFRTRVGGGRRASSRSRRTSPTGVSRGTTRPPRRPPSGWSAPGSPTSRPGWRPRPTELAEPRSFVATVCLVRHLDPLPDELRDPFVDRVLERAGEPLVLDYVRLNMTARRG